MFGFSLIAHLCDPPDVTRQQDDLDEGLSSPGILLHGITSGR
jgi:hypothetical protein